MGHGFLLTKLFSATAWTKMVGCRCSDLSREVGIDERRVKKFLEAGHLVLNLFAGTVSTVKDCLLLHNRMLFVWNKENDWCVEKAMARFVEVYDFQVLNVKNDLEGRERLMEAPQVYMNGGKSKRLNLLLDRWDATWFLVCIDGSGLCGVEVFQVSSGLVSVHPIVAAVVHQLVRSMEEEDWEPGYGQDAKALV